MSGGSGAFELVIDKRQGRKRIDSRFRLEGFQVNRQAISSLGGEVHHTPSGTRGDITVTAPDLNSRVDLAIAAGKTAIRFHELQGESRKIMRILDLGLDLDGRIAGDFTYSTGRALREPEVLGNFTAGRLKFMGYALGQVKGALRSNLQDIGLSGLESPIAAAGRAATWTSISSAGASTCGDASRTSTSRNSWVASAAGPTWRSPAAASS